MRRRRRRGEAGRASVGECSHGAQRDVPVPTRAAFWDRDTEAAEPGYYAVTLLRPDVRAEMTATRRAAHHRYTFVGAPADGSGRVVLDLGHALLNVAVAGAELQVDASGGTIEGYTQPSGRFSGPSAGGLRA
jgi:putative alpha-1,2-mannosidase